MAAPAPAAPSPPPAAEAAPVAATPPRTIPPFRVMLPIYIVGGMSIGLICLMFFTIMVLIATR
jgi:hypothetical protein